MKKRLVFLSLFFLSLLSWSVAAPLTVPPSLSATFVQKITTPSKHQTQYRGTIRLNRTREFLWQYAQPTRREICGDGSRVKIIDHDLEQVTIYKVGSLLDPMQLLKRAKLYRKDMYLVRYHGTRYTLKINAKGELEQIAFKDNLENIVNLHFSNIHYGKRPINTMQMLCPAPKSYDTIQG